LRDGARLALLARRRRGGVRDRARRGRDRAGIPSLRNGAGGIGAVAVVDATPARSDAERLQRVAGLRDDRVGARPRLSPRVPQLLAVRGASRTRGGAVRRTGAPTPCAAPPERPLPARQPPRRPP